MRMIDVIIKKRNGKILTAEEFDSYKMKLMSDL